MSEFRAPNALEQFAQHFWFSGFNWTGTDGDDKKYGSIKDDRLSGGSGNDDLAGFTGNDKLFGGAGLDTLWGGNGNDYLEGGAGDDWFRGGADNDILFGASGDDVMDGGNDNDILTGGRGRDQFVWSQGNDTITDFSIEDRDQIIIRGGTDFITFEVIGEDVLLTAISGDSILIQDATQSDVFASIKDAKGALGNPYLWD